MCVPGVVLAVSANVNRRPLTNLLFMPRQQKKTPPIATLSEHLCVQLKKKLQEYRCSLCPSKNSTELQMIVKELLLGLSDE